MTQYQKAMSVIAYLRNFKLSEITITEAVVDSKLEQSYQLIKDNPKITKEEFLRIMEIEED